jgi:hypothetical protein
MSTPSGPDFKTERARQLDRLRAAFAAENLVIGRALESSTRGAAPRIDRRELDLAQVYIVRPAAALPGGLGGLPLFFQRLIAEAEAAGGPGEGEP